LRASVALQRSMETARVVCYGSYSYGWDRVKSEHDVAELDADEAKKQGSGEALIIEEPDINGVESRKIHMYPIIDKVEFVGQLQLVGMRESK